MEGRQTPIRKGLVPTTNRAKKWPKIFAWILWNFLTRFVDTVSGKEYYKTLSYVRVGVSIEISLTYM